MFSSGGLPRSAVALMRSPSPPTIDRKVLTELPQAKIRVVLHAVFVGLTFLAYRSDPQISLEHFAWISSAAMIAATTLYWWARLLQDRNSSLSKRRWQRAASLISDNLFVTLVLLIGGGATAGLWAIYIWTSIGYGTRYGVTYLRVNVVVSTVCFLAMAAVSPFWMDRVPFVTGLALGMVCVPLYSGFLITQLHEAVRERELAYRAKSDFLARMSHELRTPLHAIISSAELLRDSQKDRTPNDYIDVIDLSSKTLLELINRVLDLSKFESGAIGISTDEVSPAKLVGQVVAVMHPQARSKGVRLRVEIDPSLPLSVYCSGTHLREVLLNLIGNAVKFTDEGEVVVRLAVDEMTPRETTVTFTVEDTGCGIPESDLARIFEPFMQADTSKTRRHDGTGLGTSYCKELIRLMGGEISLRSAVDLGTTVTFSLPFRIPAPGSSAMEPCIPDVLLLANDDHQCTTISSIYSRLRLEIPNSISLSEFLSQQHSSPLWSRTQAVILHSHDFTEGIGPTLRALEQTYVARMLPIAVVGTNPERTTALAGGASTFISQDVALETLTRILTNLCALSGTPEERHMPEEQNHPVRARPLRVLVADDNITNRKIAQIALEKAGHSCTLVDNGDEALFALNDDAYDVALLDMHMPRRHGIEVAKIYNFAGLSSSRATPIILLTADTTNETREEAASAGISRFLTKPILPSEIVRVVEEVAYEPTESQLSDLPVSYALPFGPAVRASDEAIALARQLEVPLIDNRAISELVELMEKSEQTTFFEEFYQDSEHYVATVRQARIPDDIQSVRDAMHALAGAAGIIGAPRLATVARTIERADPGSLAARLSDYSKTLEEVAQQTKASMASL